MPPLGFMLIAGEASGDWLAAELVAALRRACAAENGPFAPRFFGAGGPRMAAAGVELACDLTAHAVVGVWEAVRHYPEFKRLFDQLLRLATDRLPDVIILVDYPGFNLRFAAALRALLRSRRGRFHNWRPRLVQYVSPQLWAWHESRVYQIARDFDLLLSIFPFERDWYAARVPRFRVEFVGHPLCERFPDRPVSGAPATASPSPLVLLLPGSRERELRKHLDLMVMAAASMEPALSRLGQRPRWRVVLPNEALAGLAERVLAEVRDRASSPGGSAAPTPLPASPPALASLRVQAGGLAQALSEAELAIAASGTVTMECAWFGVPAVVLYRTSWSTYWLGRRLIKVKYLAMPNLLAGEPIYPEFIQGRATPANISTAAIGLLQDPEQRRRARAKLSGVVRSLGGPGANARAAAAVLSLCGK